MATFKTRVPDVHELKLDFALMLFDRFTHAQQLVGQTAVRLMNRPQTRQFMPFEKAAEATFVFSGLPPGDYTVQVRSNEQTSDGRPAYYLPVDVPITIPMPHLQWPAFPDITLADQDKLLDDPAQTAAYRAQRQAATLQPSVAYPFPVDATLIRGTVLANGTPLPGAVVRRSGAEMNYQTGTDGGFVLFFENVSGVGEAITLVATQTSHPDQTQDIKVHRGMTVVANIIMAP